MSPESKGRMIRMIIYIIVAFAAAFFYSYFKKD